MTLAYLLAAVDGEDSSRFDIHAAHALPPRPAPDADLALLARLRDGDDAAFDALVLAHAEALIGFGTTIVGERAIAEELAQDVFLWVWDRRATFALSGSLRTYLLTAVRRRAMNVIAHRSVEARHSVELVGDVVVPDVLGRGARTEDAELWAAVSALPLRWREAVTLRYVGGLPYLEVGRVMGISEPAARMLVRRAITELRRQLS